MLGKVILDSNRLCLREFLKDDFEAVHEYASDLDVVAHTDWGPNTKEDTKDFLDEALNHQRQVPRKDYEWAIVLKQSGHLIGACNINIRGEGQAIIGYGLNKKYWGKGFASEAAQLLLQFGFRKLQLHRIYATCDVDNAASVKVLEKLGMKREGCLREHKKRYDNWISSYQYSILEHEYKS